ncbi:MULTISPECIES: hypothetical protein [Dyadobacter]|uniref:Uncharacterized protein n=1 Tax=Dyadobacter chenhuakuii TaxID=2909339 RepID=A0A9X1QHW4_9BACT|nr:MULTISPECIES: hypothetical protein [Dyadobacter]MCE7071220.1 hypothetical protein [Dyadobacter sp. CY327]MCF2493892.1 hypothetical protein [Dyadobacter chenhuakuii]MCF2500597.1 hypothetical protein [Dyadobacter chenhuakuii]MCF2518140.1 hypothetical protein [Dyadobacter sp. CY351]USJ31023.1 hypothetical protein NFI80_24600 [Dyadobacter chenhuakuii]
MNFITNIIYYSGKLLFATILFVAMIISTIISLPFIGAGMIKDAIDSHPHQHADRNHMADYFG